MRFHLDDLVPESSLPVEGESVARFDPFLDAECVGTNGVSKSMGDRAARSQTTVMNLTQKAHV